jgi:elongation factor G
MRSSAGCARRTIKNEIVLCMCGSAFKNKGVQAAARCVIEYLPRRSTCRRQGHRTRTASRSRARRRRRAVRGAGVQDHERPVRRQPDLLPRLFGHAQFGRHGLNVPTKDKKRAHRPHAADARQRARPRSRKCAPATSPRRSASRTPSPATRCATRTSHHAGEDGVPEPVIEVAVEPKTKADQEKMGMALQRLAKEDPSFRVHTDEESGQTIISGMGELHLEIIVDRMKREFKVEANVGKPQVAYRETIRGTVDRRHPQEAVRRPRPVRPRVAQDRANAQGKGFEFVNGIVGGSVPREFIPAVEKGIRAAWRPASWPASRWSTSRSRCSTAPTTTSTRTKWPSRSPARWVSRRLPRAKPVLLEPIMKVEVVTPEDYMGDVIGDLNRRRGQIMGMETRAATRQGHHRRWCRSPRCSATQPPCAR